MTQYAADTMQPSKPTGVLQDINSIRLLHACNSCCALLLFSAAAAPDLKQRFLCPVLTCHCCQLGGNTQPATKAEGCCALLYAAAAPDLKHRIFFPGLAVPLSCSSCVALSGLMGLGQWQPSSSERSSMLYAGFKSCKQRNRYAFSSNNSRQRR
jgi:hypothetical protein